MFECAVNTIYLAKQIIKIYPLKPVKNIFIYLRSSIYFNIHLYEKYSTKHKGYTFIFRTDIVISKIKIYFISILLLFSRKRNDSDHKGS